MRHQTLSRLCISQSRVAGPPVRVEVTREPGERRFALRADTSQGAIQVLTQGRETLYGVGVHQIRTQVQHHGGFDGAAVQPVTPFRLWKCDAVGAREGEVAGLHDQDAALVPQPEVLVDAGYWWIIGVMTVAMALDGVDGQIARRTATATAFGARFDMELDSFQMLVLAALVWRSEQVGPWVMLLGLPRYLFVAAGWVWPWMRAPLPERVRRKAGCVIQGIALLVCLGPIVPPGLAAPVAALILVLLGASFAVDSVWLFRLSRT